jgi:hypothetical protein
MTKKEQREVQERIDRAERIAALRWSDRIEPDVPKPEVFGKPTSGWDFNAYAKRVWPAWSTSITHGEGTYSGNRPSGSQGGRGLYSTRELALRALRYEVACMAAVELLKIDRAISEAQAS